MKGLVKRRLIVLGSTGSIGTNTLDVVSHLRREGLFEFDVVGLAAGRNGALIAEQASAFSVSHVALADSQQAAALPKSCKVYTGPDAPQALIEAVAEPGDLVVGAIVGSAGLPATMAAINRGCDVALANKETLVAAGSLVMPLVREKQVQLLPIDSEHSALFQCVQAGRSLDEVKRLIITASGGPFRQATREQTDSATVEQALDHPTWKMGRKVTIDSATLMNKALEIIEAHWLFDMPADKIEAVIHPQSMIHSFVEFIDNSVIAQLGPPDMRTPIQYTLTYPNRLLGNSRAMDWATIGQMDFEQIDRERFGSINLAYDVIRQGGSSGAVFNAANEVAVEAFLSGRIRFGQITQLVADAMQQLPVKPIEDLADCLKADQEARDVVNQHLEVAAATH